MDFIQNLDFTVIQWIFVILAALAVGLAKAGISGIVMVVIPLLAGIFGGKESTGVLLPMLITGDIFAVWYYHRHADWKNIKKLLPWTLTGIALGAVTGTYINDSQFKMLIGILILICLILLIYLGKKGDESIVPKKPYISIISGVIAGFATMIGNAAGPIFSIYLLASGFKKNKFMGTTAWFFFIVNITKLPLQIFVWENITGHTALITLSMLPFIAIGALIGFKIVKIINEKPFRYLILCMTAISAIRLLI